MRCKKTGNAVEGWVLLNRPMDDHMVKKYINCNKFSDQISQILNREPIWEIS